MIVNILSSVTAKADTNPENLDKCGDITGMGYRVPEDSDGVGVFHIR
jgi:hypothetical protein